MQFMARVEIHNATREMYERLHTAMESESFSRVLTSDKTGNRSQMPIGTYWIESYADAWSVLESAKRAALPIHAGAEIVISGGPQLVYYNCPEWVEPNRISALARLLAQQPFSASPLTHAFESIPTGFKESALSGLVDFYRSQR